MELAAFLRDPSRGEHIVPIVEPAYFDPWFTWQEGDKSGMAGVRKNRAAETLLTRKGAAIRQLKNRSSAVHGEGKRVQVGANSSSDKRRKASQGQACSKKSVHLTNTKEFDASFLGQ